MYVVPILLALHLIVPPPTLALRPCVAPLQRSRLATGQSAFPERERSASSQRTEGYSTALTRTWALFGETSLAEPNTGNSSFTYLFNTAKRGAGFPRSGPLASP